MEKILLEGSTHDHIIVGDFRFIDGENSPINKVEVLSKATLKHVVKGTHKPGEHHDIVLRKGVYLLSVQREYDFVNKRHVNMLD